MNHRRHPMRRFAVIILVVCGACAAGNPTRVVVPYQRAEPLDHALVRVVNATGSDLPMPAPGFVEQAVEFVMKWPPENSTIIDAFADATGDRLAQMNIRIETPSVATGRLLLVTLHEWDVRTGAASSPIVFVSADYQLIDADGEVLWQVTQDRLRVPFNGSNLTRFWVERIASTCVDAALASLPAARPAPVQ